MSLPVGTVISYMGQQRTIRTLHDQGWLVCDGSPVAITDYPDLYTAIGNTYGQPSDDVFNLPDLTGMFLRGIDPDGKRDPDYQARTDPDPSNPTVVGAVIGSLQSHQLLAHQHNWDYNFSAIDDSGSDIAVQLGPNSPFNGSPYTGPTTNVDGGGYETRPVNSYVYFLILAKSQ